MILICPHCQTHYEVADDRVGLIERSVLCAVCDDIWSWDPGKSVPIEPIKEVEQAPIQDKTAGLIINSGDKGGRELKTGIVTQQSRYFAVLGGSLIVIIGAGAIISLSMGTRQSFGLWMAPMSETMGWGREIFAIAIAIQNIVWGISAPFFGALTDRWGTRRVVFFSGLLYAAGIYFMSTSTSESELYISAGLMIGLGLSGTGMVVIMAAVGRAFPPETRSLALGFAAAGGSFGQFFMIPLGQAFIDQYGWASALGYIALLALSMSILAMTLSKHKNTVAEGETSLSIATALVIARKHKGYLLLNLGFFVCGFHITFIITHYPAYLTDRGLSAKEAAMALALIGLFNVVGSTVCGYLGGRYPKKNVLSCLYFARAVVILAILMLPFGTFTVYVCSAAMGLLWLATVPLTSGLVAQIFGTATLGTLFGVVFVSHQVGAVLGVWLGGYVFDLTGSYDMIWGITVMIGVIAGIIHLPINEKPLFRQTQVA